jgi:hypothetical protein
MPRIQRVFGNYPNKLLVHSSILKRQSSSDRPSHRDRIVHKSSAYSWLAGCVLAQRRTLPDAALAFLAAQRQICLSIYAADAFVVHRLALAPQ